MALDVTDNVATHAASSILTRKYGPLPFWAWLIILTGTAYGVRRYMQKSSVVSAQSANDAAALAVNTPTDGPDQGDLVPGGGGFTTGVGNIAGTYGGQVQNPGASTVTSAYQSNAQWIVGATSVLAGLGKYPAFNINAALTKYVNGVTLSSDPQAVAIVSDAISAVGAPPEGVPVQSPVVQGPAPVVKTGGASTITVQENQAQVKKVGDTQTLTIYWKDTGGKPITGTLLAQGSVDKGKTWQVYGNQRVTNGSAVYHARVGTKGTKMTRFTCLPNDKWTGTSNVITENIT